MNDVHAGDNVLKAILRAIEGAYKAPQKRAEERLRAFLKPKLKALQPRVGESMTAYRARVLLAFTGREWARVKREIAADFTDVNIDITERINDALEQAFADGFNDAAYSIAKSGVEMWPVTIAIVAALFLLARRKVKKKKVADYNERRAQSAVKGAVARDVSVDDMARDVSRRFTSARMNEMSAVARVVIYGAADQGAYFAGLEAEKQGIAIEKTWLSIMDMRVRPSHRKLHGKTLPLEEKFRGIHGLLRFPHDPEAPPQEIYRCRCRMVVHLAGRRPAVSGRRLMPSQTATYKRWRDAQIRKAGNEIELEKRHRKLVK